MKEKRHERRALWQGLVAFLMGVTVLYGVLVVLSWEVVSQALPMTVNPSASAAPGQNADLAVVKSGSPNPVTAGTRLTYTLSVTNHGPYDATGTTLTDTLPGDVTLVSAESSQGVCGGAGPVVCSLGGLSDTLTAAVTIVVDVHTGARGTLNNTATVSSGEDDPDPDDNTDVESTQVSAEADLSLSKTDDPDEVIAGETLTYTLTVNNAGPSDATGVTVTDTLPATGIAYVAHIASAGNYDSGTGVWTVGAIIAGDVETLEIVVGVDSSRTDTLTNVAAVSGGEPDPLWSNNDDDEVTQVDVQHDLVITKNDHPDPVIAGEALTYTVNIANTGPSDATGVTVTDTLPSDVSFVAYTASAGSYEPGSGVWSVGSLSNGGSEMLTVVAVVDPLARELLTNWAKVSGDGLDPISGNNVVTVTTQVGSEADLVLAKEDDPSPVTAGTYLTYTLITENQGPSDATGVIVTDTLPSSGVTFVTHTFSKGDYDTGTGVWSVGDLPDGQTETLTLVVAVDSSRTEALGNAADVSGNELDPFLGNSHAEVVTQVDVRADVAITKADHPDPVIAGTNLTYTLTVVNNGPSDASGVTLTDTLPSSGITFVTHTASKGDYDSGTGIWTVGDLPDGQSETLTLVVSVDSSLTGSLANSAKASANEVDPTPGNNEAAENTDVSAEADLALTKADDPDPVNAGEALTYTLTITNNGPSDATGVILTDDLPTETVFVSASAGCDYDSTGHSVACSIGPLLDGSTVSRDVFVTVTSPLADGTLLTNVASISGDQADPSPASNTSQSVTDVESEPILSLAISDLPDPVQGNGVLVYTIVVENTGNENATGTMLTEVYDVDHVTFIDAWPEPDSGDSQWDIGTLEVGSPAEVTVFVLVDGDLPEGTVLNNQAILVSDQTSPIVDSETTDVDSSSHLLVSQSTSADPVAAGAILTYTFQYGNDGTAPSTGVVLTSTYDSNVTFLSADPEPDGGNNVWQIGTLIPGDEGTIVVGVRVKSPLPNGIHLLNLVSIDSNETAAPVLYVNVTEARSEPELSFSITDEPDPVEAGAPLVYTLRYTNTGNADATSVIVTATLDSSLSFVSATPPPGDGSGQVWYWDLDDLRGEGGTGETVITTEVDLPLADGTTLQASARLGSTGVSELEATARTTVRSDPILSLSKDNGVDTVYPGEVLTYVLTYANTGNENAYDVTITDTLPSRVTLLGDPVSDGTWERDSDTTVFAIPVVFAQTSGQSLLSVQVDDNFEAGADLSLTNEATMTAPSLGAPIVAYDIDDSTERTLESVSSDEPKETHLAQRIPQLDQERSKKRNSGQLLVTFCPFLGSLRFFLLNQVAMYSPYIAHGG